MKQLLTEPSTPLCGTEGQKESRWRVGLFTFMYLLFLGGVEIPSSFLPPVSGRGPDCQAGSAFYHFPSIVSPFVFMPDTTLHVLQSLFYPPTLLMPYLYFP